MAASKPDTRLYHDTSAAYSLPNDNVEHDRLELQGKALEQLMSNNIFHAPASNPKRILDVGCGTGRSTVQLAEKFPDAKVIGVDLSLVPNLHPKLKNVEYIQGDVRELVKAGAAPFSLGSFDYVFSRLLSFGMTDWPGYISDISSILASGGWFEVHEFEIGHRDAEGVWLSDKSQSMPEFIGLLHRKGLEPLIATKAAKLMQDCGLVDVTETPYKIPYAEDPKRPNTIMISKVMSKFGTSLNSLWYRLGEGVYSREELDKLSQQWTNLFDTLPPGTHTHFDVIFGHKAS